MGNKKMGFPDLSEREEVFQTSFLELAQLLIDFKTTKLQLNPIEGAVVEQRQR